MDHLRRAFDCRSLPHQPQAHRGHRRTGSDDRKRRGSAGQVGQTNALFVLSTAAVSLPGGLVDIGDDVAKRDRTGQRDGELGTIREIRLNRHGIAQRGDQAAAVECGQERVGVYRYSRAP